MAESTGMSAPRPSATPADETLSEHISSDDDTSTDSNFSDDEVEDAGTGHRIHACARGSPRAGDDGLRNAGGGRLTPRPSFPRPSRPPRASRRPKRVSRRRATAAQRRRAERSSCWPPRCTMQGCRSTSQRRSKGGSRRLSKSRRAHGVCAPARRCALVLRCCVGAAPAGHVPPALRSLLPHACRAQTRARAEIQHKGRKEREQAAVKIQARARGMRARNEVRVGCRRRCFVAPACHAPPRQPCPPRCRMHSDSLARAGTARGARGERAGVCGTRRRKRIAAAANPVSSCCTRSARRCAASA